MFATCTFDLRMSTRIENVLVVIANFLSSNWEPKHVTIGLFEATTTYSAIMVSKL
jgi:hypothetical protein